MGKMSREEMRDHDSDIANEQMEYRNRKRKPFVKVPVIKPPRRK